MHKTDHNGERRKSCGGKKESRQTSENLSGNKETIKVSTIGACGNVYANVTASLMQAQLLEAALLSDAVRLSRPVLAVVPW